MNKTDLTNEVVTKTGLQKKDAEAAVNAVFETIAGALAEGDKVAIFGFGTFETRERAARPGINPKLLAQLKEQGVDAETAKEQATIQIDASKAPAFKPAKALKNAIK
ncbi:DNA-binding protein HU-beta [Paenibacillus sophorae]|uniref:DNA-binding protein HU-beta n=1 Tax=Paenibacillus sophorae TaxID=1333845 RepID=A0A1H8H1W1_9BACL|nr:HU family DNA-binding protein [Paenibacillus sophorae]QWU14422.1 HU family DNA-binding protein [Paenibacillus sophorae]SEN50342.1 DNA-binding protein HU-beta [Paenibacillus sophorae]